MNILIVKSWLATNLQLLKLDSILVPDKSYVPQFTSRLSLTYTSSAVTEDCGEGRGEEVERSAHEAAGSRVAMSRCESPVLLPRSLAE